MSLPSRDDIEVHIAGLRLGARRTPIRSPRRPDAFEERVPGIKTRILPDCEYRGEELERREVPCCGGKVRLQRRFRCSHPRGPGEMGAWDIVCARCRFVADYARSW